MAANIKVETFDVDITTSGSTYTLTNDVGATSKAFIRRPGPSDKATGGPTGSTGNTNPIDAFSGAQITGTSTITFNKGNSTSMKMVGEVWRYIGAASGVDEFIVRGHVAVTLSGVSASQAISGIVNENKCVPFISGINNPNASVSDYDASTVAAHMDGSGNVVISRQSTTGTLIVYVSVVEFTGTNWSVGIGKSANHDTSLEIVTLNNNPDGISGSTFNVPSWSNSFLEMSMEGDTSETGLSDVLASVYPHTDTDKVNFKLHQDTSARNDGTAWIYAICHRGLEVTRTSNLNVSEGNGTYGTLSFPAGTSLTESIDELALEAFSDTSGTGTAHARGRLVSRITDATGTITHWVHRSGNTVSMYWGVINLSGVDGSVYLTISDVDSDNIVSNSQQNVIITGTLFGALQGTGKVELVQNSDYTGTKITQSVDSWSDTSIQIDISSGTLSDSNVYLYVTTDSGSMGSIAVQVGIPPETYLEAIKNLTNGPSHIWTFQNTYQDEIGTATANNTSSGNPTFSTTRLLCKGDTYSLQIDAVSEYISPADQSDMNTSANARRYIGGWIMLDSVSQTLAVLYEEGAQVNNIAFLNGFGNNLLMQVANASDDYVQLYVDKPLTPNRPYLVLIEFNASGYNSGICNAYVDGVKQSRTNGNPWETPQLDSHSGNITWGHEGTEALKVGDDRGVDATTIAFASPTACNYSHWFSWTNKTMTADEIRKTLFEKGARADNTISGDTEVNMQTDIDTYANTLFTDSPCSLEIEASSDGDFELSLDNITFEDRVSMQIRYLGIDTLTLVAKSGTVLNTNKLGTPYGGTINVINTVITTIQGIPQGAEWRLYKKDPNPEILGTIELAGEESKVSTGDITYSDRYTADTDIVLQVMADGYEEKIIEGVLQSTNQIILVQLKIDNN